MRTSVINIYRDVVPELGRTLAGLPASRWPENYVYIGRSGKGLSGPWGNPIQIGEVCPRCGQVHEREKTISCYRAYLEERIVDDPDFAQRVAELSGKTLVCFCSPKPCHGHVLAEFADRLSSKACPNRVD